MNLEYFPQFFRINYPKVEATKEEITNIGNEFKKYLIQTFKGKEDKLENIWNIDPLNIIPNRFHQLKTNGYEPALIIHFGLFVEKIKKESNEEK